MDIDVKGYIEAKKALEKYRDDIDKAIKLAVNEASLRLFRSVVKLTPTDTGWLKENWNIGAIKKDGDYYYCTIDNAVEYAEYVEWGHRIVNRNHEVVGWKDGEFMLKISEFRVEKQLDRIARRYLKAVEPKL